ncbi:MAG: TIGR02466 family protein [Candidatus Kariarchaeaceae archaeon]|jgi:uncharacterized protein (TIGR02466 family)
MTLTAIFPIIIYDTILDVPDDVQKTMIGYFEDFYARVKDKSKPPNITGDYWGESYISNRPEFSWLNEQLSLHIKKYLEGIKVDHSELSIFVQKSWPVICSSGGGEVWRHFHKNSCISAVFYLQVDDTNDSGSLLFYPPSNYSHLSIPVSYDIEDFYYSKQKPFNHKLIIFPSSLEHEVKQYTGNVNRYSVSFDITIVTNNLHHNENHITNPGLWTPI